jgi:hypothetical protein
MVARDRGESVRRRDPVVDERRPSDRTDDEVQTKGRHDGDIQPIGKAAGAPLELHLHHLCGSRGSCPPIVLECLACNGSTVCVANSDSLLPKPDRADALPGEAENGADQAAVVLSVVIRPGPVMTAVNGTLVVRRLGGIIAEGDAVGSACTIGRGPSLVTTGSWHPLREGNSCADPTAGALACLPASDQTFLFRWYAHPVLRQWLGPVECDASPEATQSTVAASVAKCDSPRVRHALAASTSKGSVP